MGEGFLLGIVATLAGIWIYHQFRDSVVRHVQEQQMFAEIEEHIMLLQERARFELQPSSRRPIRSTSPEDICGRCKGLSTPGCGCNLGVLRRDRTLLPRLYDLWNRKAL
jgi:hypothetical protein